MKTTNQNETARSGKTQALREVLEQLGYLKPDQLPENEEQTLVALLTGIQHIHVGPYTLMSDHADWLVVLQWMQDHHFFKSNPKRPPFREFIQWLQDHQVPQTLAHYDMRAMSYAHNKIGGARYPWTEVQWQPAVLKRWRVLYVRLGNGMKTLSYHNA